MTLEMRDPLPDRPLPARGNVARPYWEALAEGRFLLQHCEPCDRYQFYPRAVCTRCGADPEWRESEGRGTVYTFTIIRQNGARPFSEELPYVVAMIELEEGVKVMSTVTDIEPDEVTVGMAVQAYAVRADDGVGLLYFTPAR